MKNCPYCGGALSAAKKKKATGDGYSSTLQPDGRWLWAYMKGNANDKSRD